MTLSEIQDQINDFIVANGNNEITADVLRPILLGIVGQPNELIGDLTNLTTDEQGSLVAAINEINASLANAGGITIHTGADTPLVTPPGSYNTGDFYLQEVASVAVSFWQFNGSSWVEIKNVIDDANTATSTTWSSEKIQQAINERDGFITLGAIAYTDNSATIPAGAEWRIAGVTYTNPAEVILSIDPATAGYYRTDIIVANTSNTFQIVEGTESTGTVAPAATPANTVKADEINIFGAAVVSTGPGGGFINVVGFFDYNDEATQTTPIAFSTGAPVKLTNDTLGPFTNLAEGPYEVTTVWDPINNRFNFSQLTVGDTIDLRIDLDVTTAGANETVKVYLKMGAGSPSEYDLPIWDTTYKTAAEHNVGKYTGLYIGSEDIRDYPAELYLVSPDGSGTVKVNGWYPRIIRKGVNVYTLAVSDQDYVKKQFSGSYSYTVDGDNAVIPLQPQGYSNLILTNAGLNSVDGFSLALITGVPGAYTPYEGKILKIYNLTGSDVTLVNGGTAEVPFSFRGGEDIVIPGGEFIYLDYNILGCVDGLRSWDNSKLSSDIDRYAAASLPLSDADKLIINQGGVFKEVAKNQIEQIVYGYFNGANFYTDAGFTNLITPESGKIYINIAVTPATQYRWSGSAYTQIGGGGGTSPISVLGKKSLPSSTLTGTTAETILETIVIPANTLVSGDLLLFRNRVLKGNSNGGFIFRYRISNTNSLSGASQIAYVSLASASFRSQGLERTLNVWSNSIEVIDPINTIGYENATTQSPNQSFSLDFSQPIYLFLTATLASASDTIVNSNYALLKL